MISSIVKSARITDTDPVPLKSCSYVALCSYVGLRENRRHPASYLVNGAKALNNAFRSWTRKEVICHNHIKLKV